MSARITTTDANTAPELITVTVRDRSREAPWGSGPNHPIVREIQISAFCPNCGARRGERQGLNTHDDGAWYWVETWSCSAGCGHVDTYGRVVVEAAQIAARHQALTRQPAAADPPQPSSHCQGAQR